jgi:hypothetical protein
LSGDPGFLEVGHADVMRADAVFACALSNRAAQVGLPRPGEPLEDNVLLPGHERAGAELAQQRPVKTSLVKEVDAAQVSVRVTQPRPPDQAGDFGMGERRVGVIDDQPETIFERQADAQGLVLGIDGLQQLARVHLPQFAFGFRVQAAHRVPPA